DHHRRLSRAIRPLQCSHMPVEEVTLIEHALPVHEHQRGCERTTHDSVSSSQGGSSSVSHGERTARGATCSFSSSSSSALAPTARTETCSSSSSSSLALSASRSSASI